PSPAGASAITRDSIRNCLAIRTRLAPSAARTTTSCCRASPPDSSSVDTLPHAITSTSTVASDSHKTTRLIRPRMCERSGTTCASQFRLVAGNSAATAREMTSISACLFDGDALAQFPDHVERPVFASFILPWEQWLPEIHLVVDAWDGHLRDGAAEEVGGQWRKMNLGRDDAEHQVRRRTLSAQIVDVDVEHRADQSRICAKA